MRKKWMSLFLSFCMALTVVPTAVFAEEEATTDAPEALAEAVELEEITADTTEETTADVTEIVETSTEEAKADVEVEEEVIEDVEDVQADAVAEAVLEDATEEITDDIQTELISEAEEEVIVDTVDAAEVVEATAEEATADTTEVIEVPIEATKADVETAEEITEDVQADVVAEAVLDEDTTEEITDIQEESTNEVEEEVIVDVTEVAETTEEEIVADAPEISEDLDMEAESSDDKEEITEATLATPKLTSATVVINGIEVKWGAVKGVTKYRVYRKLEGGKWAKLRDVTTTSFIDTTVKNGKTYYYTVCGLSGSVVATEYDENGVSKTFYNTPTLRSAAAVANGIEIKWSAVSGLTKYRVYRKTDGGKWTKLKDVTAKSYIDTTAESGVKYFYTVYGMLDSALATSYNQKGVSATYYAAPTLKKAEATTNGIEVTWDAVNGLTKYRVYRRSASGSIFVTLKDVTGTSYIDTTAKSGTTYYYTVGGLSGTKVVTEYNKTGVNAVYYATPVLKRIKATTTSIDLTWGAVTGLTKYRVYRKAEGGKWTKLKDVTTTTYSDTKAESNVKYYYTVAGMSDSTVVTGYNATGLNATYYAAPILTSATAATKGIEFKWSEVTGLTRYRVYRKVEGGSWRSFTDVRGTSYVDTSTRSGTKYYYTVGGLVGNLVVTGYDTTGVNATYYTAPVLKKVVASTNGIDITWGAVTGLTKYRVYRKADGQSWSKLKDVTATTYTDKTAVSGTKYYYTVRGMSGNDTVTTYDQKGLSATYYAAPVLVSAEATAKGVEITWTAVDGLKKYRVYHKTASGSWSKLKDVTGTTYTDTTAKSGTTCSYTVCGMSGNVVASGYDKKGVSTTFYSVPTLKKATATETGITVTWTAVKGLTQYRVYRKVEGGKWAKLKDVTGTSYTDTKAALGTKYYYTVSGLSNDTVVTEYNTKGVSAKR